MLVFWLFLFGLAVGSFLNVLIDRLPKDESVLKGRSYCDKCKKELKWYDLIPVVSFVLLGGKCRYCHSPISFYYPIVEITTGAFFVLVYLYLVNIGELRIMNYELRFSVTLLYHLFIASSLIVIFFTDLKYGIIPDKIVYPAIVISFFFVFFTSKEFLQLRSGQAWLSFSLQPATFEMLANKFFSALVALVFFLFLYFVTRGKGMGFGDVKLAFLMGLFLGFPKVIVALYIAFLTGAVIGTILVVWKKKKLLGSTIAFGPFLVLGTFLALFYGDKIASLALRWLNLSW